eukprot:TRINITY_DN8262_c1_g1_i7.p5 TRINITY_DN8262_c1_g1~~TRINITY_DN8262_c1_g1_i7.p5  ORF type:complete len:103 (+),score=0.83 TRINITY_DN8262_c1_g1_i7:344-652(+)
MGNYRCLAFILVNGFQINLNKCKIQQHIRTQQKEVFRVVLVIMIFFLAHCQLLFFFQISIGTQNKQSIRLQVFVYKFVKKNMQTYILFLQNKKSIILESLQY